MKPIHAPVLAGILAIAGCALMPDTTGIADNPFYSEYQYPPFDKIRNEHFMPAFVKGMADELVEVNAIAHSVEAPTFENTVVAMERTGRMLDRVEDVFDNLTTAHTNAELNRIDSEIQPKLAAHRDSIFMNAALYARFAKLYAQREALNLDPESRRLLEKYHEKFLRAGVKLDATQQARLRAINEELAALKAKFEQSLQNDTNASAVVVDTREELEGMSEDAIAAAAEAAKARNLPGKYVIQIILPTPQPALATLKNRALRERLFKAAINRGNNNNEHDTKAIVARVVKLRAERAALLGYPNHAAYQLEVETARTPQAVNQRLAQITPAAVANARREARDLQKLVDRQRGGFRLEPWDWAFYSEQVRKARYDFDESQMKPYFELNRVLQDGVFYMARQVYGLSFKERPDLPVYEPTVRAFEVFNEDGSTLGFFLFDPFARESKRGGAWMNEYISQSVLFGEKPVVGNHLNIPAPPKGQPALLTFDEVNTLFHEFGHALHGLFSTVKYPFFAGTEVPRDFVEYPSQVHEMWVTWPEILRNYAKHYQTGEPMPQALLDKVKAAEKFNQGFTTTEYLAASLLDQAWHQLGPAQADVGDVIAFEAAALKKAGALVHEVPSRYRTTYFNHIFGGDYSAGYYSYIWSEVLDADTVEWFRENGGMTRRNGDLFREKLLSKGGSTDALALFRSFRGREPDIAPLLERRGLRAGKK